MGCWAVPPRKSRNHLGLQTSQDCWERRMAPQPRPTVLGSTKVNLELGEYGW